jgi:hypothetical protein
MKDLPKRARAVNKMLRFNYAASILAPPDKHGSYAQFAGILYVYQGNLFSEADDLCSVTTVGTKLARLVFQDNIPIPPVLGAKREFSWFGLSRK